MAESSSGVQASRGGGPPDRWTAYRPLLEKLLFAGALLGVLVTVHLYIQQGRGFDRGCLGFTTSEAVEAAFDCEAVTKSEASNLLGVSNAVWGLLFYLLMAALTAGVALASEARRPLFKRVRLAVATLGFAYSLYLGYYQYGVLGELCALCLISAAVATILFVLQGFDVFSSSERAITGMTPHHPVRAASYYGALAALTLVLAGADLVYFNRLEASARAGAEAPAAQDGQAPRAEPTATPSGEGAPPAEDCTFDPEKPVVEDFQSLITVRDPVKGNAGAPVTIVEFFDPNCPHCKTVYPLLQALAQKYPDVLRIVYKPVSLWQFSVQQNAALFAAAQENKFGEMLEAQFEMQRQGGLTLDELKAIAARIGMDPAAMEQRIREGTYLPLLQKENEQASDVGVTGVPALILEGRFVSSASRTMECLSQFIEEAAEAKS